MPDRRYAATARIMLSHLIYMKDQMEHKNKWDKFGSKTRCYKLQSNAHGEATPPGWVYDWCWLAPIERKESFQQLRNIKVCRLNKSHSSFVKAQQSHSSFVKVKFSNPLFMSTSLSINLSPLRREARNWQTPSSKWNMFQFDLSFIFKFQLASLW